MTCYKLGGSPPFYIKLCIYIFLVNFYFEVVEKKKMVFEEDLKKIFVDEDGDRYPMLFLPTPSHKKQQHKLETVMAFDVLYQLYFYVVGEKEGKEGKEGKEDFIHPLYRLKTLPFMVVKKKKEKEDDKRKDDDKDEKIIIKFLKEQLSPREENFDNVMVHVIMKTIEVKNYEMFYIIWRALEKDIMTIYKYVKNMQPHQEIVLLTSEQTKGISEEGDGKKFKIVYKNDGEDTSRGGYNIEPHLLLFRIDPNGGKSRVKLNDTNAEIPTKLEVLYSNCLSGCSLKKFQTRKEENGLTLELIVYGEEEEDEEEAYYVFALFYRISPDASTLKKFARNYPFYQVVAQTRPVKLSHIWKRENVGNEFKIDMITGAVNSSISIDESGNMITNYQTKTDSHLLISPLHFQTTLKASPLPMLPSHDKNRQTLRWIYEMNGALVGNVKQSLVFQAGCGVFDVCPFPLATYAKIPPLPEEFFIRSLEKTYSVFGNPEADNENVDEYHNEFLTVFFTVATSDMPYINDRLYGKSSDDMRNIRGVNSGDCDDAAIMIYQTVMYFLDDERNELKHPVLKKLQKQVKDKYLPGICVMSLVSNGGDIGLHQICILYPYELYKDMIVNKEKKANKNQYAKPILLEGTSKSFSSIYPNGAEKEEEKNEMIRRYASALCSVYGPSQLRSKFCSYQLDAPNMLPDNYHAYYNNILSFSSGDVRDTSKFRYLRFTNEDKVLVSEGVHYRKVLNNSDYWLVDADFPSIDAKIYKEEMIESAKCIFPIPEINYNVTWDTLPERKTNVGFFNEQHLLDLIDLEMNERGIKKDIKKKKSSYKDFNLDRVVFTLRRCYFDKNMPELLRELQNIVTLCKEKKYTYSVKSITCFPTDQSIDLIIYF